MSNWKAGDKALCVDDSPGQATGRVGVRALTKGTIYLVTHVFTSTTTGNPLLNLAGIDQGVTPRQKKRIGFRASRFRKIVPACDRISQEQEGLIPHEGFFEGRPDL